MKVLFVSGVKDCSSPVTRKYNYKSVTLALLHSTYHDLALTFQRQKKTNVLHDIVFFNRDIFASAIQKYDQSQNEIVLMFQWILLW